MEYVIYFYLDGYADDKCGLVQCFRWCRGTVRPS